jgi:hypothetical protein
MTKQIWSVATTLLLIGSTIAPLACVSPKANRTLRYEDLQSAANTLADNILASPRFVRAKEAASGRDEEVVIALLEPVTVDSDDFTGDLRRKIDEFFDVVPEVFLQRDVGEFRKVSTKDGRYLGSEQEGRLDAFDFQDSSKQFDQESGATSTQGKAKAVIAMEAIGKRDRIPGGGGDRFEFVLRIKMFDVVRKTQVYSGSVLLAK